MPRTLATQAAKVLTMRRKGVACRVRVKDSTGTFQDLRSFLGRNWVAGVEFGGDVDELGSATVRLWRDRYAFSLAPLVETSKANLLTGSYAPLIDAMREIIIETALLPEGVAVTSGDWFEAFRGFIDTPEWGGARKSVLTLECRDLAAPLTEIVLEKEGRTDSTPYGVDPAGRPLEEVMQDVLDDWAAPGGYTIVLYTPTGTVPDPRPVAERSGFNVTRFVPAKAQSVWETIRILANSIGYDVKVRWSSVTNNFRLELYNPPRSASSPDVTLAPGMVRDVERLKIDPSTVRNAVRVTYQTNPDDENTRTFTETTDATSISRYRRRWFEVAEAASSPINSATEANKMRDAILADLKDPKAELIAETMYRPDIVLNDLIRFSPDAKHFTSNQDLACVSIRHRIEPGGRATTSIATRGKPCGQFTTWQHYQAGPGLGEWTKTYPGKAGTVTLTATVGGMVISLDASNMIDRDVLHWEYHVSTSNGFTPDRTSSSTTRVARGWMTRVEVSGLTPGTTYYVKVLTVRRDGVVSAASTQQLTIPVKLGNSLLDRLDYIELKDQGAGAVHRRFRNVDGAVQATDTSNVEQAGAVDLKEPTLKDSGGGGVHRKLKNSGGVLATTNTGGTAVPTQFSTAFAVTKAHADGMPYALVVDRDSTNYIKNPSFEVDTTGWEADPNGEDVPTISAVTSEFIFGAKSCFVDVNDASHSALTGFGIRTTNAYCPAASNGDKIAASAWVKLGSGSGSARIVVQGLDNSNNIQGEALGFATGTPVGTDWVKVIAYGTLNDVDITKVRVEILVNGPTGAFDMYVDGVMLEKGTLVGSSYLDGSLGAGYAWTGTANDSTSTRTGGVHQLGPTQADAPPFIVYDDGETAVAPLTPSFGTAVQIGQPGAPARISGAGTTFPAFVSTNDLFFRTDRGILYYYDGSQWLSVTEYCNQFSTYGQLINAISTNGVTAMIARVPDLGGTQVYLTKWRIRTQVSGTNNATNYWQLDLKNDAGSSIANFNTSADGAAGTDHDQTPNSARTLSTDKYWFISCAKAGSGANPGNMSILGAAVQYRLIG